MLFTERDEKMVSWIGHMGAASIGHVAGWFGVSEAAAYQRLRMLCHQGFLDHRLVLHARPALYWATRKGLRWQGIGRFRAFRVDAMGFEHAYRTTHAAVELHRALPEWGVVGEREMRLIEADRSELFASMRLPDARGRKVFHRPDLALTLSGVGVTAVEVELSEKTPARLAAICRGWARARHISHVYYVALPGPARAVRRAVKATNSEDRITVLDLDDIETLAAEISVRADAAGHVDDRAGDAAAKV